MQHTDSVLRGHSILAVEDEPLVLLNYNTILHDAGAGIILLAPSVEAARKVVAANCISAALLDIRLGDGEVWPVACRLAEKGVPFAFCTGFSDLGSVADQWPRCPILTKPVRAERIISALAELLATDRGQARRSATDV